ncbi:MAG: hypothetical protein MET45_21015 [Nostoc sp. LLA-1]|nr:hypothetical protein [Cyanocohniella sp. LLY]
MNLTLQDKLYSVFFHVSVPDVFKTAYQKLRVLDEAKSTPTDKDCNPDILEQTQEILHQLQVMVLERLKQEYNLYDEEIIVEVQVTNKYFPEALDTATFFVLVGYYGDPKDYFNSEDCDIAVKGQVGFDSDFGYQRPFVLCAGAILNDEGRLIIGRDETNPFVSLKETDYEAVKPQIIYPGHKNCKKTKKIAEFNGILFPWDVFMTKDED